MAVETETNVRTESTTESSALMEWSKTRIIKNLLIISLSMCLYFCGLTTLNHLQSSINLEKGLGAAALSVIATSNMISGIFLATYVTNGLGLKKTILLGFVLASVYDATNFKASWYILMPTSPFVGASMACSYCAYFTYVTHLASHYSRLTKIKRCLVISRFFGIFFMARQSGGIVGGLVSYFTLSNSGNELPYNETNISSIVACGKDFCDKMVDRNASHFIIREREIYLMSGILIGLCTTAFVIVLTSLDTIREDVKTKYSFKNTLKDIAKCQRNILHILLIPVTIYCGLEISFVVDTFGKAFTTCSSGVRNVGLVLIAYFFVGSISSLILGQIVKIIGRIGIFVAAAAVNFSVILTMLFWAPGKESLYVLFIMAALWGFGDGVWQGQLTALYGSLFPDHKEIAFAIFGVWRGLGIVTGFLASTYLCTIYILYSLMLLLISGVICYLVVEYLSKKEGASD